MPSFCSIAPLVLGATYEKTSLPWWWLQTQQQWSEQFEAWFAAWAPLQAVDPAGLGNLSTLLLTLIGLALVYWVLVWRARRPWSSQPPLPEATSVSAPTSSASWLARARALQQAGDYRGACLSVYQAFLLRLAEREIVGTLASRTDGEYRQLLARQPETEAATLLFEVHEKLAYGDEGATAETCKRCERAFEQWR